MVLASPSSSFSSSCSRPLLPPAAPLLPPAAPHQLGEDRLGESVSQAEAYSAALNPRI